MPRPTQNQKMEATHTFNEEINQQGGLLCHCGTPAVEDCSWTDLDNPCRRFLRCPHYKLPHGCSFKQFTDDDLPPYYRNLLNDLIKNRRLKAREIETLRGTQMRYDFKLRHNNIRWAARMAKASRNKRTATNDGAAKQELSSTTILDV